MTYSALMGTLNPTHSLTNSPHLVACWHLSLCATEATTQPHMVVALRIVNSDKMSLVQMYVFYELKGTVKELNMFHNYETEKITRKASDVTENLQLYQVVRFFCPRSLCTTMHLMLFSERLPIYAACMTISGGRTTKQLYNCRFSGTSLTGFTSDFIRWKRPPIYVSCMMISGGRTKQHITIGVGELAAVD